MRAALIRWTAIAVSVAVAAALASAAGVAHASTRATVTVTGVNLAGQPASNDPVTVVNVDRASRFDSLASAGFFRHGVAKFTVPDGHYWAFAVYFQGSGVRLVVLPQFTVSGPVTVHTAARMATSKVTVVTPRPSALRWVTTTVLRGSGTGPPSSEAATLESRGAVYVSPVTRRPGVGSIRLFSSDELGSPAGAHVPYQYVVTEASPPGTIPADERYPVLPGDLATVRETYYRSRPAQGRWQVVSALPAANAGAGPVTFPLALPGRPGDVLYAGGNVTGMSWQSQYWAVDSAGADEGGQLQGFTARPAGRQITAAWNRYPLHAGTDALLGPQPQSWGVQPSASRSGNTLRLDVTPFTDNQAGDTGSGFGAAAGSKVTGSYEIDQNGTKIAGGNAVTAADGGSALSVQAPLGGGSPVVRFSLTAARSGPGFGLATSSHTVWTWRSASGPGARLPAGWYCWISNGRWHDNCAVQPMMTLRYDVAGLAGNEAAPSGAQTVTIVSGHLQLAHAAAVTGAKVWASFDAGKTWRPARVTRLAPGRYRASFTAPAHATVALRTTATDAAGGSVTETITGAYITG